MITDHTPGPWWYSADVTTPNDPRFHVCSACDPIAIVRRGTGTSPAVARMNARLIAEVPEMIDILSWIFTTASVAPDDKAIITRKLLERARALVEKLNRPEEGAKEYVKTRENALEVIYHQDNGHGWFQFPIGVVEALSFKPTCYSYRDPRTGYAYLEEDQDGPAFIERFRATGATLRIVEKHEDGESFIRDLPRFAGAE